MQQNYENSHSDAGTISFSVVPYHVLIAVITVFSFISERH